MLHCEFPHMPSLEGTLAFNVWPDSVWPVGPLCSRRFVFRCKHTISPDGKFPSFWRRGKKGKEKRGKGRATQDRGGGEGHRTSDWHPTTSGCVDTVWMEQKKCPVSYPSVCIFLNSLLLLAQHGICYHTYNLVLFLHLVSHLQPWK